ncbi:ATP-binding cassette domain-containing protein [Amycolatopsis sp. NPDC005232]|uniref:ABC transporter ATP-binding protein n=1 Tax=Amycolatopsis sp. NPDC005232 TaxID=3157027 RepID=UPI0033BADF4F
MLRVEGLRSGYGSMTVLHGVDLAVDAGELLLIAGANGAGKSTLLSTIAGFVPEQAGTTTLDGTPLRRGPSARARAGVRLVHQGHRVFGELTVRDNLRLGGYGLRLARRTQRFDEVVAGFPLLAERLDVFAGDLSGGQQQVLAIAQAMMLDPPVLLCDEPSLGVAQVLIPPIMAALRARADSGRAVVVVEQLVDQAIEYADRLAIVDRGTIPFDRPAVEYERDPSVVREILLGAV